MVSFKPVTVIEMGEFLSSASKCLSDEQRADVIDFLASNPQAGDLVPGTGGVRKLRWKLEGRGKSGGARIIYFYHNQTMPLFALGAFAKSNQSDISQSGRNNFRKLTRHLVDTYQKGN